MTDESRTATRAPAIELSTTFSTPHRSRCSSRSRPVPAGSVARAYHDRILIGSVILSRPKRSSRILVPPAIATRCLNSGWLVRPRIDHREVATCEIGGVACCDTGAACAGDRGDLRVEM